MIVRLGKIHHNIGYRFEHLTSVGGRRARVDRKSGNIGPVRQNGVVRNETPILEIAVPTDDAIATYVDIVSNAGCVHYGVLPDEHVITDGHRVEGNSGIVKKSKNY